MIYKFADNEIIRNTVKLYPKFNFKTYNNGAAHHLVLNDQHNIKETAADYGQIDLYDFAGLSDKITRIVPKVSSRALSSDFPLFDGSEYGTAFSQSYPVTFGISVDRILSGEQELKCNAINRMIDQHYRHMMNGFSDVIGTSNQGVITIPRMFYGSSIKKGSVFCRVFSNDSVPYGIIGSANDVHENGLLYLTEDSEAHPSGTVVGCVLYDHGIVAFRNFNTASSSLALYDGDARLPSWDNFLYTGSITQSDVFIDYEFEFRGTNPLNTITMFAHAPKGQLNHSNNKTYIKRTTADQTQTGSLSFIEYPKREIKNVVYNPTDEASSFSKETYINKIGIFDEEKRLIAVSKVSNPVRKRAEDGYTFKLKLDLL